MEIDKAIEINEDLLDGNYEHRDASMEEAIHLGIEALKRVKAGRPAPPSLAFLPLPGEDSII